MVNVAITTSATVVILGAAVGLRIGLQPIAGPVPVVTIITAATLTVV